MLTLTNKGGGGGAEMAQIMLTLLMDDPLIQIQYHAPHGWINCELVSKQVGLHAPAEQTYLGGNLLYKWSPDYFIKFRAFLSSLEIFLEKRLDANTFVYRKTCPSAHACL